MNLNALFPQDMIHFFFVAVLSFLVGLELKTYHQHQHHKIHFGSARTYTFIGIMGFIFYKISFWLYFGGFVTLSFLYAIHYSYKLQHARSSVLSFLIMSIVYSFGALITIYPIWMPALLFVTIVFILGYKNHFGEILSQINEKEFETLGKFILLSAVILPILPNEQIKYLGISPFKIWLVVVVISAISYGSYLAQKFIFKNKGFLITGILGGLYSSTATSVVLAKKAYNLNASSNLLSIIESSIIVATAMMYLRLLVIAFIFNKIVAEKIAWVLIVFSLAAAAVSFFLYKKENSTEGFSEDKNPLELSTALIFAVLFVAMMVITKFVTLHYGNLGLKILSFIIGFTDIDPFVLSLLTGKFHVQLNAIASAIIIAAGSNNILKAIYTLTFSKKRAKKAAFWLFILGMCNICVGILF